MGRYRTANHGHWNRNVKELHGSASSTQAKRLSFCQSRAWGELSELLAKEDLAYTSVIELSIGSFRGEQSTNKREMRGPKENHME